MVSFFACLFQIARVFVDLLRMIILSATIPDLAEFCLMCWAAVLDWVLIVG